MLRKNKGTMINMNVSVIIFYVLAAMIILGGILSVTCRKIFRAAIYLLFSLIGIAGVYFYLDYEFIAAVQIVVYVGGIVVLLVFSIFLTHGSGEDMQQPKFWKALFSGLAAMTGLILTIYLLGNQQFNASSQAVMEPSMQNIGTQLLSVAAPGYSLPFELVSMLLLAALIGCIVIAIKPIKFSNTLTGNELKDSTESKSLNFDKEVIS